MEEDAYARLEKYLAQVRAHFASMEGAEEIASDIEDRLAEQFEDRLGKNGILTIGVVEEMIKVMGEPQDFGTGHQSVPAEEKPQGPGRTFAGKRLMRNGDDVIIAGVCSGIAAYIGTDSVWIRLIFAASVFLGGTGVVLYIILWIIMPEAKTETEKMQMRGEPINLKAIEQTVKERAEEFKKKDFSKTKRVLSAPFKAFGQAGSAFGRIFGKLFSLIFRIIGGLVAVAGSLAIAGLVVATVSILFNANSPYVDFPLREIATSSIFYLGVTAAFFVAFVPIIFLVLLGATLLAYKSAFSKMGSVGLLVLWIISLAIFANIGIKYAPQVQSAYKNRPEYQTISKTLELKDFSRIRLYAAYEATVYPSDTYKVVATGRQKDLDELEATVADGTFIADKNNICLFCWARPVRLEIYLPKLEEVNLSGASKITAAGFEPQEMTVKLSGASRADLNVKTQKIFVDLSGASNLEIKGEAVDGVFKASGASGISAKETDVKNAEVELSGASRARFGQLDSLSGKASGASKIYFFSALQSKVNLSGASKIIEE